MTRNGRANQRRDRHRRKPEAFDLPQKANESGANLASADADRTVPRPGDFGVVIYDLETIHDAERGTYFEKGLHECAASEQITWKRRSQIIEFAAIDLRSGARLVKRCRPEFKWADVRSPAARRFAEDHGHDQIIQDSTLPQFNECWVNEVMPFLQSAAGKSKQIAMIAHNGDAFDHFVLEKELQRLGLSDGLPLSLHRFDPVRTLKRHYGQDYGWGGRLTLNALHEHHVPPRQVWQQHQALDDCQMLLEVLSHWQELNQLLAVEIANCFCGDDGEVATASAVLGICICFGNDLRAREVNHRSPPHEEHAAGHELRVGAMEFVPGVLWTASGAGCGGGANESVGVGIFSLPATSDADLDALRLLPQYQ